MSWNYNNGNFYISESGYYIYYLEQNPCKCCPDALLVEYKSPLVGKKTRDYTIHIAEEDFAKERKLIKLT